MYRMRVRSSGQRYHPHHHPRRTLAHARPGLRGALTLPTAHPAPGLRDHQTGPARDVRQCSTIFGRFDVPTITPSGQPSPCLECKGPFILLDPAQAAARLRCSTGSAARSPGRTIPTSWHRTQKPPQQSAVTVTSASSRRGWKSFRSTPTARYHRHHRHTQ